VFAYPPGLFFADSCVGSFLSGDENVCLCVSFFWTRFASLSCGGVSPHEQTLLPFS